MRRMPTLLRSMWCSALTATVLLLLGLPGATAPDPAPLARQPVTVTEIISTRVTAIGQPIVLPKANPRVIVSEYVIAPGVELPVHKHPFARYALVLEGTLRVARPGMAEAFDYQTGDFIIEMIDAWHYGANIGQVPVRLIVIDQVEDGSAPTILKDK